MLTLWSVMASATARSHVLLGISTMSLSSHRRLRMRLLRIAHLLSCIPVATKAITIKDTVVVTL